MAKKAGYYVAAEQLYLYEHLTLAEIAARIPVSERTLGDWQRDGKWSERREKLAEQQASSSEKAYELSNSLMDDFISAVKEGKEPSQWKVVLFGKISPMLERFRKYEQETERQPDEGVSEKTVEQQKQVVQDLQETLMKLGLA
jgi:hypothetical protein